MRSYIIFLFAFISCNRALLVPQKDVIRSQSGYLVFYYDNEEVIFFPWADTVDAKFLRNNHKNGYRLDNNVKDIVYLKELAVDQKVTKNVFQEDHSIQVDETIKLLPVDMRFFWGEGWRLKKLSRNG